jgi:ribosomal protein S27AE
MAPTDSERSELRLAPRAEEASRAEPASVAGDAAERAMRTCPICGSELAERKCKLSCARPGCGYFLSCSDYY